MDWVVDWMWTGCGLDCGLVVDWIVDWLWTGLMDWIDGLDY